MKKITEILTRYIVLLIFAFPLFFVFYTLFTPLTVYPSFFLFNLFFDATLNGNIIFVEGIALEIVKACVAGSAFFLLLLLNLTTPKIELKKRLLILVLTFAFFLFINILRIFFIGSLFVNNSLFFSFTHLFFWYFVSVILVILIWFFSVKIFEISSIPIYDDVIFLYKEVKRKWLK